MALGAGLGLSGCGGMHNPGASAWMDIAVLGFNDFHGNLEPPGITVTDRDGSGQAVAVPAGGAAHLASAVAGLRVAHEHSVVVAAGDLVGASPMVSSMFLDEPSIEALNLMGLEFSATGNHEYDQGAQELLRLQHGGCEQYTSKVPCRLNGRFAGARFQYLAANTLTADGNTLLPPTGLKFFEQDGVRIGLGFIGLTLRQTPNMVRPSGVAGLRFADEAETVNALIPSLRARGADVIVVLIHEGGATTTDLQDDSCEGLSGDIVPILQRLSPEVDVVVSGHTHRAYICDHGRIDPQRPFLLTSAGLYGSLLTEIELRIDTGSRRVLRKRARQHIVQGQAQQGPDGSVPVQQDFPVYAADEQVAALVARYREAVAPLAAAPVGELAGPALRTLDRNGESVMGRIVADATLAATQSPEGGGAQLAFLNSGGIRADLLPDAQGSVNYGQIYSVQPFGNTLMVMSLSGDELRRILEQQFDSGTNTVTSPRILQVSSGFSYSFDLSRPAGERISNMQLHGTPIEPQRDYRVGLQSYLGSGGDNFSMFRQGRDISGGSLDLDALADYLRTRSANGPMALPQESRIRRVGT
ncbi:MAG: bifunctional metallophosphatase/5'-nucleotidase [Castellaniella sp.]